MKSYKEFLRNLLHPGPISTLVLIKTITLSVIYCSLMWWPPNETIGGLLSLTSFLISSGMVMFHFFSAIANGPGFLPLEWIPSDSIKQKLQYCGVCKGYKAPRTHHCRKCGRCVMKLDHHCPWINNCVGHYNHAHFVSFLFSALVGCSHGGIVLACSLYRAMYRTYYMYYGYQGVPFVYLGLYGFVWCLFSCGCAVGVSFGVGILLYYQMKVVLKNETTIEEWIIEKAEYRRRSCSHLPPFNNPYDLGWKENFKFVMNWRCCPITSGILDWPVGKGCDQFSMTIEQIQQKNAKRRRTKEYIAIEKYSGSWFPITKGFGVITHPPCSDEPRISLEKDDQLLITRWKTYWLYGEKITDDEKLDAGKIKGWLPRKCVVEVMNSSLSHESDSETEEVLNTNPQIDLKKDN